MIREFIPALFSLGMALAIALGGIGMGLLLGKVGRRNKGKDMAMIFILFDIEVIFMYPWAVSLMGFKESGLGWQVFGLMLAFVLLVEVGHLYAYKKGVFEWNKRG